MRRLFNEELEGLKDEFVAYLIMNGLDAAEWQSIKEKDRDKAEEIILQFSHSYFTSTIAKIQFIEYADQVMTHAIHVRKGNISEFVMYEDKSTIGHREHRVEDRNQYIFELLEKGYQPSKGELYRKIALLHACGNSKRSK